MNSVWKQLIGRTWRREPGEARASAPRPPEDHRSAGGAAAAHRQRLIVDLTAPEPVAPPPPSSETGPRRYLAVVARDRPDLIPRVARLLSVDQYVEPVLDRRRVDRRQQPEPTGWERRLADRRQPVPGLDLARQKVMIVEAAVAGAPYRLSRWVTEGRELLATFQQTAGDRATIERECQELRERVARLQADNERLRAREAQRSHVLDRLASEITQALGEVLARLRAR